MPKILSLDKTKNELVVKNFLGEKTDRRIRLVKETEVKIIKDIIEIESYDKEAAGQTAANLEKATVVRKRDRRVFQDGIFLVERAGVAI